MRENPSNFFFFQARILSVALLMNNKGETGRKEFIDLGQMNDADPFRRINENTPFGFLCRSIVDGLMLGTYFIIATDDELAERQTYRLVTLRLCVYLVKRKVPIHELTKNDVTEKYYFGAACGWRARRTLNSHRKRKLDEI